MACVDERALLNKGNKLVKLKIYKGEGIIISRKGKAGNLLYVDEEKYTLRVKSKYVKDISLKYVLYTMRKWTELCVISDKGGNRTFNKTLFEKMEMDLPGIDQQEQVVEEYEKLEKIYFYLQQKKKELHKTMSKIVKVNGEIYKVKDIFDVSAGKRIKEEEVYLHKGNFPCATAQTSNNGITWYADKSWLETIGKKHIITVPCITWTKDGAKTGTMFYRDYPFYANDHCGILIPKREFEDAIYMKWFVFSQKYNILQAVTARTGQTMLYKEQMKNVTFQLPSYKKQVEIAKEYERLDEINTEIKTAMEKIEKVLHRFP